MNSINISETVACDMIVATDELVKEIVDHSIYTEDGKEEKLKEFRDAIKIFVMKTNFIWIPSTNTYHPVIEVNIKDRTMIINEEVTYENQQIEESILSWGNNLFRPDYKAFLKNPFETSDMKKLKSYFFFKSYFGAMLFDLARMFIIEYRMAFLPCINPENEDAHMFLSLNLNSWWDRIINQNVPRVDQGTGDPNDVIIPYIRPVIAVKPKNLMFCIDSVGLINMANVLCET